MSLLFSFCADLVLCSCDNIVVSDINMSWFNFKIIGLDISSLLHISPEAVVSALAAVFLSPRGNFLDPIPDLYSYLGINSWKQSVAAAQAEAGHAINCRSGEKFELL